MITALSLSPAVDKIYHIDNFEAGGLFRLEHPAVKSAGGKGINVARVASLLGEKVTCAGFKAGYTGEWLEAQLVRMGVEARFIPVEGESRVNSNIIDRIRGTETEILEVGPEIPESEREKFLALFKELLRETSVLVCSGGLPKGIPTDFYRSLIDMAKTEGVRVLLDSSSKVLAEGVKAKPYLIKPNRKELSQYAGKELLTMGDIIDACRVINCKGVEYVAASLGKEGALLVTSHRALYVKSPEVEVQNTIGSGDSMVAGIAVGLSGGMTAEEAFLLGTACSVANTQFVEIGIVTKALVEKYLRQIKAVEL